MSIQNIVQHPEFINLITQTLFLEDSDNTIFVSAKLLADGTHFFLYKNDQRVILLKLQPCLNRRTLNRTIRECLDIHNEHYVQPFVVIVTTNEVPESIQAITRDYNDIFPWEYIVSDGWAEQCIIISKDESSFLRAENPDSFDSFLVIATYFLDDEAEKEFLRAEGDLTIQLLDRLLLQ